MGLRDWFGLRKPVPIVGGSVLALAAVPEEQEPLTPEQVAELKDAWAELAEAAKESAATNFHACSRGGKPWQEDPAAVRSMAALLRSFGKEEAATEGTPIQ